LIGCQDLKVAGFEVFVAV